MNAIEKLLMAKTSEHERELTVTVAGKFVGQEFNNTVNNVQRVANRPGFRPGKMPKSLVLSFYGAEIKAKLMEKLIEKSFDEACKNQEVIPVSKPRLEPVGELSHDKPFTYRAIFQVKPKVSTPDFMNLSIEMRKFVFTESDVEDELNNLRESMATFVEPVGRTEISENDLVTCDSVVKLDDKIIPAYCHSDYTIPMFAENLPANVKEALLGRQVEDTVSIDYEIPADDQDESIRGKTCEMIIKILSFKERSLPNLDDDFAKDLSDKFQTLEDIKESCRLRFSITAKRRDEYYKQDAITKALIEKNPLDVPPALVERMSMSLINRELEAIGQKVAEDLVKNHWQEIWQSVQSRALFRVKAELLFEALIDALNITANDEEVSRRVENVKNITRDDARYSIQVEKLLALIEKEANVTVIEEPLFKKGA